VAVSEVLKRFWYIVILSIGGGVFGAKKWANSKKGRAFIDRVKLQIPVVNKLLSKIYAARFARTLSALSAVGVALPQALAVTARSVINRHIENELYKVVDAVNRGEEMSAPLERMGLLMPMVVYMAKLGEESGMLVELLNQAADYYDEESESALQALMAMMDPALIVLMAIIVVPILIAVLMPMFNMYSLIG
jgi:type IV pilus assembly protein PilC